MRYISDQTVRSINSAVLFMSGARYEEPPIRPWQYVQMEYERVGLVPPAVIPDFSSIEEAQIWMCLDSRYNSRLYDERCREAV